MSSKLDTDQMGDCQCTDNPPTLRLRNSYDTNTITKEDPKDPSIKSVLLRNLYFPKQYCVRFTYMCDYFGNGNYFCYINYLEWLYNIKKT